MPSTDSQEERRRLISLYSAMSDGELQKLAADAGSLTELACELLEDELERRELDEVEVHDAPAQDDLELRRLVTIRQFRDLPAALLAKGMLESAGIECFLGDDNMVRLDWFISNLLGGIKLRVAAQDAEAATELLEQPLAEDFEVPGAGEYRQPRCPKCDSIDVTFEALNKPVAYTSAFFGVPLPIPRNSWKCEFCGHRWQEDPPASS